MSKYYEKKITLGRDREGRLVRRSIYAKTKAELNKKIFAAQQDYLQNSAARPNEQITFIAYARRWFKNEKAIKSPYTAQTYKNIIEHHLAPRLEGLFFDELTLYDFQEVINDNFGQPATCRRIKSTLMQIYAAASDDDVLTVKEPNFRRLTLPQYNAKEQRALTDREKEALFEADLTNKEKAYVYLLYYTGMRREEILALEPSCFDFQSKPATVAVKQTVTFTPEGTIVEKKAKTRKSLRVIPLPRPAVPFLKEYCSSIKKWLFPAVRDDLQPMPRGTTICFWYRIRDKLAAIAPTAATLHPHSFRHNYATMLVYSNVSTKKAAELLGHSNTKMIMEIYAHIDEQKENAAEKLNAVFGS